jgi:AcrR family transcriptional regulator
MGTLASLPGARGLPRGRGSLPPAEVAEAQRERILRAMTAAVAELGYASVRIADVVERARVSRQSFYAQFTDKGECFLAAHARGVELILAELAAAARAAQEISAHGQLRAALRTYLRLVAEEPEFAQCMLIELQAIGPAGLQARLAAHEQIAALLAGWHAAARVERHGWPEVPSSRYAAAVGAVHDMVFALVAGGRADEASGLEDAAVDAVAALLELPAG